MLGMVVTTVTSVLTYTLVIVVGLWCYFQWKKWDLLQAARKMPPAMHFSFPFFGHIFYLLKSWEGVTAVILEVARKAVTSKVYNVVFWCGPLPLVMVHKLEDIQKILTTSCTAEKADETKYLRWATGNGLLSAPGHIWKMTRRHINPLFHQRNVEQLMTVFNRNSRELTENLADHVDGKPVNVLHPTMTVALKTVCQLCFGPELEFDTKTEEFKALVKVVEMIPAMFVKRIIKPWLRFDFIFELLYRKELNEANKTLKNFTENPLKVARANYLKKFTKKPSSTLDGDIQFQCEGTVNLIDAYTELIKNHPQFSETDLKYELSNMYGTGTDTVGLATSTCLLLLAKYGDVQDRVYEEINTVVGQDDDVTTDHIGRMTYLDQVCKEALRWATLVPYIIRKTGDDLKLSTFTVPAGNTVVVCLIGPQLDPSIYPDPYEFDPDRFSPENSADRAKFAYLAFSAGSRMCIGKAYSEHLLKTMLIHILRRYKISTDMDIHNLRKKYLVTLVNSEGYNIKFVERK